MHRERGLILIAHPDLRALMSLYSLLDAAGYFVSPCFSRDDLLKTCSQYKTELVLTSDSGSDDEGRGLLLTLMECFPETRILLLPEVLGAGGSNDARSQPGHDRELLRIVESLAAPLPPVTSN